MGIGGISIWQLLIILAIIVLIFGTRKLRSIGSDLGGAVKGFKKAVTDDDNPKQLDEEGSEGVDTEQARADSAEEKK